MSDNVNVELSDTEREVLLRGLRYVRSSIMLDVRDPEPEDEARRTSELNAIATLVKRLNGYSAANAAANV